MIEAIFEYTRIVILLIGSVLAYFFAFIYAVCGVWMLPFAEGFTASQGFFLKSLSCLGAALTFGALIDLATCARRLQEMRD